MNNLFSSWNLHRSQQGTYPKKKKIFPNIAFVANYTPPKLSKLTTVFKMIPVKVLEYYYIVQDVTRFFPTYKTAKKNAIGVDIVNNPFESFQPNSGLCGDGGLVLGRWVGRSEYLLGLLNVLPVRTPLSLQLSRPLPSRSPLYQGEESCWIKLAMKALGHCRASIACSRCCCLGRVCVGLFFPYGMKRDQITQHLARVLGGREQQKVRCSLNHRSVQRVWGAWFHSGFELLSLL